MSYEAMNYENGDYDLNFWGSKTKNTSNGCDTLYPYIFLTFS